MEGEIAERWRLTGIGLQRSVHVHNKLTTFLLVISAAGALSQDSVTPGPGFSSTTTGTPAQTTTTVFSSTPTTPFVTSTTEPDNSSGGGGSTDLTMIVAIAGACIAFVLLLLTAFVLYQRASLGKLQRRRRSRQLDLQSLSQRKPMYDKKMQFELSASGFASDNRHSNRRRSKQTKSDPVLLSGSGAIAFDGLQMMRSGGGKVSKSFSDMALASDLQNARARMHAKNAMYSSGSDDSDETDGFDDLVSMVLGKNRSNRLNPVTRSTPASIRYASSASSMRKENPVQEAEEMDGTPKQLVRHYSWYASGNRGFSAALESGQEVTSPFALMVSRRMAEHRSGANSPLSPNEPLEEEELEDMLISDPEMGTDPEHEDTDALIETSADESGAEQEWDNKLANADWLP